ncbi:MAG TPA: Fic family protein [Gemmatimonadales bacterium]
MTKSIIPLDGIAAERFKTFPILERLNAASRGLAEFKGIVATIPNQEILVSSLAIQEAKDSSEIENIVTTHDEIFREASFPGESANPAAKEVLRYRQALTVGTRLLAETGLITNNHIIAIQAELEQNDAGFRRLPGTKLKDGAGRVVYEPPQEPAEVLRLMGELERFINGEAGYDADPMIRMALIHHQFESIHPFYDGNGRTGRIVNVLYLINQGLLDLPVLYMSRYIVRTKSEYYRLLQAVRVDDAWEEWVTYMLTAVERTAHEGIRLTVAIRDALLDVKHRVRKAHHFYSQDLINYLFSHPYARIQHLERELGVSRITATKYLDRLAADGILEKMKLGRNSFYINTRLYGILTEMPRMER